MANRFVLNETSYHGKGAIKEIGTHDELCRLNGDYVRLWTQFTMQNSA